MRIQILGTGCPKCRKLAALAEQAVRELGVQAEVEKVTDINEIVAFGVVATPALAVDGVVKVSGKIPSLGDVKKWIGDKR